MLLLAVFAACSKGATTAVLCVSCSVLCSCVLCKLTKICGVKTVTISSTAASLIKICPSRVGSDKRSFTGSNWVSKQFTSAGHKLNFLVLLTTVTEVLLVGKESVG